MSVPNNNNPSSSPSDPRTELVLASNTVPARYQQYIPIVKKIFDSVPVESTGIGYERLETLCTKFGHRISGSQNLEHAIDWLVETMKSDQLENIRTEPVIVPKWERNLAYCYIIQPKTPGNAHIAHSYHNHKHSHTGYHHSKISESKGDQYNNQDFSSYRPINCMAIGQSVSTSAEGITAELVIFNNFDEIDELLAKNPDAIRGKLVFFNCKFTYYGDTVMYRATGAKRVEPHGAAGVLVRSITPTSLYTPHTGTGSYSTVPAVTITIEDAELLARLAKNNPSEPIILHLFSSAKNYPAVESRNTLCEITGSTNPEEIVVIGGHIDSWDAHDDGQAILVCLEVIRILTKLNLRPRRTIRFVAFTDEENRSSGGKAYLNAHKHETEKTVACMESDVGCWKAIGFGFGGEPEAKAELVELMSLFTPYNVNSIANDEGGGRRNVRNTNILI